MWNLPYVFYHPIVLASYHYFCKRANEREIGVESSELEVEERRSMTEGVDGYMGGLELQKRKSRQIRAA
ncbi:hypothetical protein L2E82_27625 [Cichorium intybus]|uniref:Uncharacterized protein n=1 Tax=Cichorium intybus TaxID=13427 RepID=A0ACB9CTJ5_CICIN|nr:hypothetical protein L2E82_27625 [Cichorium intybus]